jgi:hypothetical protein
MNSLPLSESLPRILKGTSLVVSKRDVKHPPLSLVLNRSGLGPAGADIDHIEGLGEIPYLVSSIVGNRVHLDEAWTILLPLGEGARVSGVSRGLPVWLPIRP